MSWIYSKGTLSSCIYLEEDNNSEKIIGANFFGYRKNYQRFINDKLFVDNSKYTLILDGVILNSKELLEEYQKVDLGILLIEEYQQHGNNFMSILRGPFTGLIYDKEKDKIISFCNQTGDAPLFYYKHNNQIICASDFNMIINLLKSNNISYSFNQVAAKQMLTFGYLIDDNTFAKEIIRLRPGRCVVFENAMQKESKYHSFINNKEIAISIDDAVELIDSGFKKAVTRCFNKDVEYNYWNHCVDLSGGFDSRMVSLVAKNLGYTNITNITYCKSDSNEEKAAKSAAKFMNNGFILKTLDDKSFLFDIDEIVLKNWGLAYYAGITGGNQLLSSLNFNKFGLEHTGQLGDVVVGSFSKVKEHSIDIKDHYKSSELIPFSSNLHKEFDNQEIYNLYVRGFQGALTTHCIRRNYTEAVSPFIDVEFMTLCLSLPLEYRINHRLYYKWLEKKYPETLKLPSTRKIPQYDYKQKSINILKKIVGKKRKEIEILFAKLNLANFLPNSNSMNPFDYWYNTDNTLKKFVEDYKNHNIERLNNFPEIKKDIDYMYNQGKAIDKFLAMTVMSILKNYF